MIETKVLKSLLIHESKIRAGRTTERNSCSIHQNCKMKCLRNTRLFALQDRNNEYIKTVSFSFFMNKYRFSSRKKQKLHMFERRV